MEEPTEIQVLLRGGQPLVDLAEKYQLNTARGKRYPNLVSLGYKQVASELRNPLVRQCRGLVLDEADNWCCVARGFDKFFNAEEFWLNSPDGEGLRWEESIDWASAVVTEKVDGTLCMLYQYQGEWHVATTGSPDGSGQVNKNALTFADLFWQTYQALDLPPDPPPGFCWLFELTGPLNRVVVRHKEANLTLLGARRLSDWQEFSLADIHALRLCWPDSLYVKTFSLVSVGELLSFARITATLTSLNPLEQEGYVVCDQYFNRIKCKSPAYVALHHQISHLSPKSMLDVVRRRETPELLAAFPELQAEFARWQTRFEVLLIRMEEDYQDIAGIEGSREFAEAAREKICPAALFAVRKGQRANFREFFADYRLEHLYALLERMSNA